MFVEKSLKGSGRRVTAVEKWIGQGGDLTDTPLRKPLKKWRTKLLAKGRAKGRVPPGWAEPPQTGSSHLAPHCHSPRKKAELGSGIMSQISPLTFWEGCNIIPLLGSPKYVGAHYWPHIPRHTEKTLGGHTPYCLQCLPLWRKQEGSLWLSALATSTQLQSSFVSICWTQI